MIAEGWVRASLVACAAAAAPLGAAPGRPAAAQDPAQVTQASTAAPAPRPAPRPAPAHTLTVTVTDEKGRHLTGLSPESFTLLDGGRPREIVSFAGGDVPATVGVLLDASGSMLGGNRSARVREALLRLLRERGGEDEFFLIAFNQSPQLLLGRTSDAGAVLAALDRYAAAEPKGQTALYDALYLALNQAERGRHRKRAVLLVTDGQDNMSRYKFEEVRRMLRESDVIVYAVGIVSPYDDSALDYGGRAVLEELAGLSGGRAYFPSTVKELEAAMEHLAAELRSQYMIGFVPAADAAKKDGWHGVRLKLGELRDARGKKIKAVLRARAGFYDVPPPRQR